MKKKPALFLLLLAALTVSVGCRLNDPMEGYKPVDSFMGLAVGDRYESTVTLYLIDLRKMSQRRGLLEAESPTTHSVEEDPYWETSGHHAFVRRLDFGTVFEINQLWASDGSRWVAKRNPFAFRLLDGGPGPAPILTAPDGIGSVPVPGSFGGTEGITIPNPRTFRRLSPLNDFLITPLDTTIPTPAPRRPEEAQSPQQAR